MKKLFLILPIVLVFVIAGCEQDFSQNSTGSLEEVESNSYQPTDEELEHSRQTAYNQVLESVEKDFPGTVKDQTKGIDYWNYYYFNATDENVGSINISSYDSDYFITGGPFQQIAISVMQNANGTNYPFDLIIPMDEETYNSLYKYGTYATFSFVTNDPETGLTGLKASFDPQSYYWYGGYYALLNVYRYGYYNSDPYPLLVESYFAASGDAGTFSLGPVMSFSPGNPVIENWSLSGNVFYDVNENSSFEVSEPGFEGVEVTLSNGSSTFTDSEGNFEFTELPDGDYTVSVAGIDGFISSAGLESSVSIAGSDVTITFGFSLDLEFLNGQTADSYGLGFWKSNINKANRGRSNGAQVSAATLESYRSMLESFGLSPLNYSSLIEAETALDYSGGDAAAKLQKHLTASEYNFANGAFLNGNSLTTWAFLVWGEYIVENASDYNNGELNSFKDIFESYNNGILELE